MKNHFSQQTNVAVFRALQELMDLVYLALLAHRQMQELKYARAMASSSMILKVILVIVLNFTILLADNVYLIQLKEISMLYI